MTQSHALSILKTGANVFLTGEPGSGKTHTINEYVAYLRARGIEPAITASTGISATHIGGMTIHSWSGIGIKTKLDKNDLDKISS
ncbi:MAG: AAA family ATPase, partial [Planctomycetota bacterium]